VANSTAANAQPLHVTSGAETSTNAQATPSDPALEGTISSAMQLGNPSNRQLQSKHHPKVSKDLTGLTTALSDLKIAATDQNISTATTTKQKMVLDSSEKKENKPYNSSIGSSVWAPKPLDAPSGHSAHPFPKSAPQYAPIFRTILVPANNNPGSMQAVSGMEVIGTLPIVTHQLASPSTTHDTSASQPLPLRLNTSPAYQENSAFHSFPPRPDMFHRN